MEGFLPIILREFFRKVSGQCFGGKKCNFFAKKLIRHSFEYLKNILQAWSEGLESTLFTTKTCFPILFNQFSHYYLQESFNGDSFVSQSRFDAYANGNKKLLLF